MKLISAGKAIAAAIKSTRNEDENIRRGFNFPEDDELLKFR
ncbi:hypothetical protein [Kosakonia sp. MUSA4]|nr:hypothetical protein [Kosakonia sp. MUSA4]